VVTVVAALIGLVVVFPDEAPAFIRNAAAKVGIVQPVSPPAPLCPLTGEPAPHGRIPDRPVLAVKVENLPEARPQAGLDLADIVYEELVEGGITRFIAVYQCHDAERVGPVRSGRLTDPDVLVQFGHPAIGYAGGANQVVKAIDRAGLIDVNYLAAANAYSRDPVRPAPHDLYASTRALWRAAGSKDGAPEAVFSYAPDVQGRSRRASTVHLPFSGYSDVSWKWSRQDDVWLRSYGSAPDLTEGGSQVSAANVVVMSVKVTYPGTIVDAAGNPSPQVTLTGSGKAYVFRDGRMILGRWERASLTDVMRFVSKDGEEIVFAPGTTWVELFPSTLSVGVD
jgi:hypothetical protein